MSAMACMTRRDLLVLRRLACVDASRHKPQGLTHRGRLMLGIKDRDQG